MEDIKKQKTMLNLYLVCLLVSNIYFINGDDDLSGSGFDEDPMKIAKAQSVNSNPDLSQSIKSGNTIDIDNENLMAEPGARQVMHTIASKLASHTSNKITNHLGKIIKSKLGDRKSGVSSDKSSSLSSSTEVVLPASSVAKLHNINDTPKNSTANETTTSQPSVDSSSASNSTATADTNNSTASTDNSTIGNSTITQDVKKEENTVKSFVKAPPAGPMETIKVELKGSANSYSNFSKPIIGSEEVSRGSKADILKFEDGLTSNEDTGRKAHLVARVAIPDSNTPNTTAMKKKTNKKLKATIETKKTTKPLKKNTKVTEKKKTNSKKLEKNKASKKSSIENFPKIILYQGPISKALESMLNVHSTPLEEQDDTDRNFFNAQDTTDDIKRSRIPHVITTITSQADRDNDIQHDQDMIKRSKINKKGSAKNVKKDGKSSKSEKKQTKTEKAKKKFLLTLEGSGFTNSKIDAQNKDGSPVPILTINSFNENNNASTSKSISHLINGEEKKGKNQTNLKAATQDFSTNVDPVATKLNDFANQMSLSLTQITPDLSVSSLTKTNDKSNQEKSAKQNTGTEISSGKVTLLPKPAPPASKLMSTEGASTAKINKPGNTGGDIATLSVESDDEDDDNDEDDDENPMGGPAVVNGKEQSLPMQNTAGTPEPVINMQVNDMPKQGKPEYENPSLPAQPPPQPSMSNMEYDEEPPTNPGTMISPTHTPAQDMMYDKQNDDIDSDMDTNSQIEELFSRLNELEDIVYDLQDEVRSLEKNVSDQAHKISTDSFDKFTGPIDSIQGEFQNTKPQPLETYIEPKQTEFNQPPPVKQPGRPQKILKEFFVPLPAPDSPAAKAIQQGAPVNGLPFPINQIVSDIFRKMEKGESNDISPVSVTGPYPVQLVNKPWRRPQPLPDVSFPPQEHDIDRLELELGKQPISREDNKKTTFKKPRIIIFSKSPNLLDLIEKPCDEECQNGGRCLGNNVCKCPHMFTGKRCEKSIKSPNLAEEIVEILNGDNENEQLKKSDDVSMPLLFSEPKEDNNEEDDENRNTAGEVEQSKVVDYLSHLFHNANGPFSTNIMRRNHIGDDYEKRHRIPPGFRSNKYHHGYKDADTIERRSKIYPRYNGQSNEYNRYIHSRNNIQRPMSNRYRTFEHAPEIDALENYRKVPRNKIHSTYRYPENMGYYHRQW